jgi:hypothetical protein
MNGMIPVKKGSHNRMDTSSALTGPTVKKCWTHLHLNRLAKPG